MVCYSFINSCFSFTTYTAKPTEVGELESVKEFISTIPEYDLPTKREKTELEEYDTSNKQENAKQKPLIKETTPQWDKLEKKPADNDELPNKLVMGKGKKKGNDGNLIWYVLRCVHKIDVVWNLQSEKSCEEMFWPFSLFG